MKYNINFKDSDERVRYSQSEKIEREKKIGCKGERGRERMRKRERVRTRG